MRSRIALFVLVAALAFALGFLTFTPKQALWLVQHLGYWLTLMSFGLFVALLWRSLHEDRQAICGWREASRSWVWPALTIVAGSIFLHVHETHGFKIVMDEVIIQGTAMKMHALREVGTPLRGYDFAGNYLLLTSFIDKRPLFFPFLLSLVHDLTGYRVANGVILNAVLTPLFLLMAYLVGRRLGGSLAGIATVILFAGLPLLAQNVTSSGFEVLNLLMIVLTCWLGMRYAERPDDARLGAFLLSGVLLAQVRYESVIFLLPVAATIIYVWFRERRISLPWPVLLSPLLLLVYPWQYNVFKLSESSWQLRDKPGAESPFGLGYFYDNVGHALNYFFSFDGSQGNSWLIAVLGVVGMGFLTLMVYRQHREIARDRPAHLVALLFLGALALHGLLMLCYFWGQFDDPVIRRLSLPSHLLLVFAFVLVLPSLVKHPARFKGLVVVALLHLVTFAAPHASRHAYTQENFAARTNNWLADYIHTQGDRRLLAIDGMSHLLWLVHGKSSLPMELFAKRLDAVLFHYRQRSFDDVLVVQRMGVDADTGERIASLSDQLGDGVTLEMIDEYMFTPVYVIRLSRVTAVDEDKVRAWAEGRLQFEPPPEQIQVEVRRREGNYIETWFGNLP